MCTTHAHTDAHTSEHAAGPRSGQCGREELPLGGLTGRRAELDRDIAAREPAHAERDGLHHTA